MKRKARQQKREGGGGGGGERKANRKIVKGGLPISPKQIKSSNVLRGEDRLMTC